MNPDCKPPGQSVRGVVVEGAEEVDEVSVSRALGLVGFFSGIQPTLCFLSIQFIVSFFSFQLIVLFSLRHFNFLRFNHFHFDSRVFGLRGFIVVVGVINTFCGIFKFILYTSIWMVSILSQSW